MGPSPNLSETRSAATRRTILDAFARLIVERRYESIRIADLVAVAGIGRATLYEHFRGKNEIMLAAIEPILLVLSTAASGRAARSYVRAMVGHVWDRRSTARPILTSTAAPAIQRRLAAMIRVHVERRCPGDGAPSMRANGIAAAQLAMLRCWLSGEASGTVDAMTDRLIDCAKLAG